MTIIFFNTLRRGTIAVLLMALLQGQASAQDTPPLAFEWQHFEDAKLLDGDLWSPDNRYLAVSSLENDAILMLDGETWEVARRLELPATEWEVSTLQWSPNGDYIAVASSIDLIVVDVRDGSSIALTNVVPSGRLDTRWMEGDVLAVLSKGDEVIVTLIDISTQEIIRQFELYDYEDHSTFATFDWNAHFRLFAAPLHTTYTIGFWDEFGNLSSRLIRQDTPNSYQQRASQCGITGIEPSPTPEFNFFGWGGNENLLDMQWSSDGTRLALTIYDWIVVCTLNPEMDAVTSIRQLGIPNPDYDPDDLNLQHRYNMPRDVSWSPDNRWLLASQFFSPPEVPGDSCGIGVFDATQDFTYAGEIGEEFCHVWSMSWSSDGSQLAIGNGSDGYWIGTLRSE